MTSEEHEMLQGVIDQQGEMMKEIHTISRGLYGDPQNGVKGLIQRQEDDETEIRKLKAFQSKLSILWGMIVVGSGVIWEFVKARFL